MRHLTAALLLLTASSTAQTFEAYVTVAQGQVSMETGKLPWAVSAGERVPIQRLITTGVDGYAHFEVKGGGNFDIYSNSKIVFRQNASSAGDLLDVLAGHVRIHLNPGPGQLQQRIFCPVATITAVDPATIALAIDEDDNVRLDVLEGEVRVQHTLLPRSEPTIVKAIDAILIQKDQQISRRVDRGSLYRYAIKPLHDLLSALTPGRPGKNFT
jgi:ferric-dicitrate binding protein FerR (iron transport regulator)